MNKETILFLKSQKLNLKKLIRAGLDVTVSYQYSLIPKIEVHIKNTNDYIIGIGTYYILDNNDFSFSKVINKALEELEHINIGKYIEKFNNEIHEQEVK